MPFLTLQPSEFRVKNESIFETPGSAIPRDSEFFVVQGDQSASDTARGLIEFTLLDTRLRDSDQILDAFIVLTANTGLGAFNADFEIHRIVTPWTESGVTWTSRNGTTPWAVAGGDKGGTPTAISFTWNTATDTIKRIDITTMLNDALDNRGELLSLLLQIDVEAASSDVANIYSDDRTVLLERPKLVVHYHDSGLTINTEIDFDVADAGNYDFDGGKTEFVAPGICRLQGSSEENDTVITPNVDRSSWVTEIHQVVLDRTEPDGYFHKFLVSFDQENTWKTNFGNGWFAAVLTSIATVGVSGDELEAVRSWEPGNDIQFAVFLKRESGGGTGEISTIRIGRGDVSTVQDFDYLNLEAIEDVTLSGGGPALPDFPIQRKPEQAILETREQKGYISTRPESSQRDVFDDLRWTVATEADKALLVAFLKRHYEVPFNWTAPGRSEKPYRASEPTVEGIGRGVHQVVCSFRENFPSEGAGRNQ